MKAFRCLLSFNLAAALWTPASTSAFSIASVNVGSLASSQPPTVLRIDAASPVAEETSDPLDRLPLRGRFIVSRTGPTNVAVNTWVHYLGTATMGVDYPYPPWLVTIPEGAVSTTILIEAISDKMDEGLETVTAVLSNCPPPWSLAPCVANTIDPAHERATVFIRDNGLERASITITRPPDGSVFQSGETIPIEATTIDLDGYMNRVEFWDGDRKIGESEIHFIQAPEPGTPIELGFEWAGAPIGVHEVRARGVSTLGLAVTSSPVHITVTSDTSVVSIVATRPHTSEPGPAVDVAPGVFTVHRSWPTNSELPVYYHVGGTASNSADYIELSGFVLIPAGAASARVEVIARPDGLAEGPETVRVGLYHPPIAAPRDLYVVGWPSNATVTIHDWPDGSVVPIVSIHAVDAVASEGTNCWRWPGWSAAMHTNWVGTNTARFAVRRIGDTNSTLDVHYRIEGMASNGLDYATLSGVATIPAGRRAAEVIVVPLDDLEPERPETVVLGLIPPPDSTLPPQYLIGTPRRAGAIIVDNDHAPPSTCRLWDDCFHLRMPGSNGQWFRVECSSNLLDWSVAGIGAVTDGAVHFVDPEATESSARFYRVVPEPPPAP